MLAILTRISRDNDDKVSIETQLESGIKLATNLGISYKQYEERVVSSIAPLDKRPMLMQMVKDIEDGIVSAVFVYDQTRLERSVETRTFLLKKFEKYKVKTYYNTGFVDSTSEDKLIGTIFSAFGEYTIELTSAKIKLALDYNTRNGKVHALSPYGYYKDNNKQYAINEEQAEVIREIYAMSLNGIGTNKIAEILNQRNIPTKYNLIGKGTLNTTNRKHKLKPLVTKNKADIKWTGNSIRGILYNKFYCGIRTFNGVEYEVPKLFEFEYWKKVNDNLQNNRNNSGKVVTHKYLLKGLLTCGRCGRNYYGRSRVSKKDNAYICSSKRFKDLNCGNRGINIDKLDEIIWNKFIIDGNLKKLIVEHFKSVNNNEIEEELKKQIKDLNDKINVLKNEKNNLLRSIAKGIIEDSDASSEMNSIRINLNTYDEALFALNEKLASVTNSDFQFKKLLDELDIYLASNELNNISILDKKEILNKFINNIIIYFDDKTHYFIEIEFNIPFMQNVVFIVDMFYKMAYEVLDINSIEQDFILMILNDKLNHQFKQDKSIDLKLIMNSKELFNEVKKHSL
jgi:DNA invertase Pin-like site-specific DNA recombinase